jgi:hypothetical protein
MVQASSKFQERPKVPIGYYGSDLNKFVGEFCAHTMTCINIDCLLVKFNPSLNRIRIIEFKHLNENLNRPQYLALRALKEVVQPYGGWKCDFYVVRGDYPFQYATVQELNSPRSTTLNQIELIEWLEFEREVS